MNARTGEQLQLKIIVGETSQKYPAAAILRSGLLTP